MTTYVVIPQLSEDFRATCDGWDEDAPYKQCKSFEVESDSFKGACELVFAICNSYFPDEMFCSHLYALEVDNYRKAKNRSFSVGDLVTVSNGSDIRQFACEMVGFVEITNVPH